jgi:membrane dipeptidase
VTHTPVPVFDGHNDTLLKLELGARKGSPRDFLARADHDHIDLPRAREGGFAGGFFAMFSPSRIDEDITVRFNPNDPSHFAPLAQPAALDFTLRMAARALRIERASQGAVSICRSVSDIRDAMARESLAMLLHIEGAEAIDADFTTLETLHAMGLRSLGPVWSRSNIFGHGAPMTCPASPDSGPGLTDTGKALVAACNELKILVDLSHLTEKGFWDVAAISDAPLVATHSNAHALTPSARNLTDRQLDAIAETGGVVGLNFHVAFLDPQGRFNPDLPVERMVRHLDHLLSRLGENGVALGSDFDGCMVPRAMKDVAGLQVLVEGMRKAGYGEDLITRIAHGNWLSVLERTLQQQDVTS